MYVTVANNTFPLQILYLPLYDNTQCVIEASSSSGISYITGFYTWLCSPQACNIYNI